MSTAQESNIGGLILPVSRESFAGTLSNQEIDVHRTHFPLIFSDSIRPGLPLFIFVCEERNLYGCFVVQSRPYQQMRDPGPVGRVPFAPTTTEYFYADEASFGQYISNNYYGQGRFRLAVTSAQANAIIQLLRTCPVPMSILPTPAPPSSHIPHHSHPPSNLRTASVLPRTSTVPPRTASFPPQVVEQAMVGLRGSLDHNNTRMQIEERVVQNQGGHSSFEGGLSNPRGSCDVQVVPMDPRNAELWAPAPPPAMKSTGGESLHRKGLTLSTSTSQPPSPAGAGFWQPGAPMGLSSPLPSNSPSLQQTPLVGFPTNVHNLGIPSQIEDNAKNREAEVVQQKNARASLVQSNFKKFHGNETNFMSAETAMFIAPKGPKETDLQPDDFEVGPRNGAPEWKPKSGEQRAKQCFDW